jgi:hypothetical protein
MNRKRIFGTALLLISLVAVLLYSPPFAGSQQGYSPDSAARFKLSSLKEIPAKDSSGKPVTLYDPRDPYAIFINYELGMHCVGFEADAICGGTRTRTQQSNRPSS